MKKLFIVIDGKEYEVVWINFSNNTCVYYDGTMFCSTSIPNTEEVDLDEIEYELVLK